MEIREAQESDIPAIVGLLKLSLGESLMPKSEAYWRWKHVDNPFGPSPVLLCFEQKELVGVRAFMRWEWIYEGVVYKALRAVDTATHPAHQGKGIFKKLTLELVRMCGVEGYDFIFNTPNEQSKPGYLKMGWIEAGRLPISVSLHKPVGILMSAMGVTKRNNTSVQPDLRDLLDHPGLPALINSHKSKVRQMVTNTSMEYLKWRYVDVPVVAYAGAAIEKDAALNALAIWRLKDSKLGREFRITDVYGDSEDVSKHIRSQLKKGRADYGTFARAGNSPVSPSLSLLTRVVNKGPIVTIRKVGEMDLTPLKGFVNWAPTTGDLELF